MLSDIPLLGPLLFRYDGMVYLAVAMTVAVHLLPPPQGPGLIVRAVGENHDAAHALGLPGAAIRFACVLFGGAMAGSAEPICPSPTLPVGPGHDRGRGWIALALVIFATWRPCGSVPGAYLFGFFTIAQLHAQAFGSKFPPEFLSMAPYLATMRCWS